VAILIFPTPPAYNFYIPQALIFKNFQIEEKGISKIGQDIAFAN
jgi:hypothetical protein